MKSSAALQRVKNHSALQRIVSCVEYLGRLGIPLGGHRDLGHLQLPAAGSLGAHDIDYNQCNVWATLQLMAACNDTVLRQYIETAGWKSSYIYPQVQNDIISACNSVLQRSIIAEVNEARFFSLLADETTDVSRKEQLTVCLRYVHPDFNIRERFLCFAEAPHLTGMDLSVQMLSILRECHIDTNNMVGQGYDGAAAMSGHINGVQKHIREQCPSAVYVHCASHSLNLSAESWSGVRH